MAPLPGPVSRQHVDQDSDDILQARAELNEFGNMINSIRQYLVDLFGAGGSRELAISSLFQGQAVIFPTGTRMFFMQATVPPGWTKVALDIGRYLMAVSGNTGGQPIGSNDVWLQSSATSLIREHLPAVNLVGVTDWQGVHEHSYGRQNSQYIGVPNPNVVVRREDPAAPRAWIYNYLAITDPNGNHYHNITVPLGGANWGHDHWTNMASYRPAGIQGVIGQKT